MSKISPIKCININPNIKNLAYENDVFLTWKQAFLRYLEMASKTRFLAIPGGTSGKAVSKQVFSMDTAHIRGNLFNRLIQTGRFRPVFEVLSGCQKCHFFQFLEVHFQSNFFNTLRQLEYFFTVSINVLMMH